MNGVGDDGGYVRFHAPHLGSGLRRKDGVVGSGFRRKEGGGGVRRKDVECLPQTGRGTFETVLSTFLFLPPSSPFFFLSP